MSFEKVIQDLKLLFESANIDSGHGIDHAVIVLSHAVNALEEEDLPEDKKLLIKLASFLHDSDDSKFFPQNTNNENTRTILQGAGYDDSVVSDVIRMINLVSCSKNRNQPHQPSYELIPRWADRLEAIGEIGLLRSYIYAKYKSMPLYTLETPRATSVGGLFDISTIDRFNNYHGVSRSMVDHMYDKVLHLVNLGTQNLYLRKEAEKRHMEVVDFCLKFGQQGYIEEALIAKWDASC